MKTQQRRHIRDGDSSEFPESSNSDQPFTRETEEVLFEDTVPSNVVSPALRTSDTSPDSGSDSDSSHDNTGSESSSDKYSDNYEISSDEDSDQDSEIEAELLDNLTFELSLYGSSEISVKKAVFFISEYYIKNKATKSNLQHLLRLLTKLLPGTNRLPNTNYKFFKYLQSFGSTCTAIKHYFCKNCMLYCGIENLSAQQCTACETSSGYGFFFAFDIGEQIKFLFEHRYLGKILQQPVQRDPSFVCDVVDGSEYKRANETFVDKSKYDLCLTLNTDGIKYSNSSKVSFWPVMFSIVEVPEHLRETFIIVNEAWYDEMKPNMNTLMEPLSRGLNKCFDEGVTWVCPETRQEHKTRVIAPYIVGDAPARAELQNIMNFNGRYGCNICEIKMIKAMAREGLKRTRIYPFPEDEVKLRNKTRMLLQAGKVIENPRLIHRKGVKGHSIISIIPGLDLSTCVAPEYMHSLLLGAVKLFLCAWFLSNETWNLKLFIKDVDNLLLNIRPPNTFNRMPRSITLCGSWKASELLNWLLFYSVPIMMNYLPPDKFQHWILLVSATYILLQKKIDKEDLKKADLLLRLFVRDIKVLYSDRLLTYNTHQLLHLSLFVSRWVPYGPHQLSLSKVIIIFLLTFCRYKKCWSRACQWHQSLRRVFNTQ